MTDARRQAIEALAKAAEDRANTLALETQFGSREAVLMDLEDLVAIVEELKKLA